MEHARALEVLADIAHATDDPASLYRLADAFALCELVNSPHADRGRERLAAIHIAVATGEDRAAGGPGLGRS
ncbi:hypothetical protein GCM10009634_74870 [Saccharothrix xinjiangensis]